jgi:L-amino acid N-acyltransferase YncA
VRPKRSRATPDRAPDGHQAGGLVIIGVTNPLVQAFRSHSQGIPAADSAEVLVRPSTDEDVPAMLAIYRHHVQHGVDAVDVEPLHVEDIKRRRKNMLKHRLPHIVAERAGVIVGYAYAVPFRKRPAYRYAVKHSIYVHAEHQHAGVGRKLLPALIDACAAAGFRQMIAYIDATNMPSLNLHEAFAFTRAGVLHGVGFKFGRWTDSVLMQRALGPGDCAPPDDDQGIAPPR